MKLCKDCKYCLPDTVGFPPETPADAPIRLEFAGCGHPRNAEKTSPVDGTTTRRRFNFASTMRTGNRFDAWTLNKCGEPGRWFEPKES